MAENREINSKLKNRDSYFPLNRAGLHHILSYPSLLCLRVFEDLEKRYIRLVYYCYISDNNRYKKRLCFEKQEQGVGIIREVVCWIPS